MARNNLLIIDEVSMLSADLLDKLDFIGRKIRRENTKPFGGLQIVFSGDFLQLAPVKAKWVFQSIVWKEFSETLQPVILEEPKRYDDIEWFERLLRFRKANHNVEDIKFLH